MEEFSTNAPIENTYSSDHDDDLMIFVLFHEIQYNHKLKRTNAPIENTYSSDHDDDLMIFVLFHEIQYNHKLKRTSLSRFFSNIIP